MCYFVVVKAVFKRRTSREIWRWSWIKLWERMEEWGGAWFLFLFQALQCEVTPWKSVELKRCDVLHKNLTMKVKRKLLFFCRVNEKGIFVVGHTLICFPQVVFVPHHAYSDLQLATSCWLFFFFFPLMGWSTGTSMYLVLTTEELNPAATTVQLDSWTKSQNQSCISNVYPFADLLPEVAGGL